MNKLLSFPALALLSMLLMSNSSTSVYDMKGTEESSKKFKFMYSGVVNPGLEIMPLVGQMSKDGNKLYFSSQNHQGERDLYISKRSVKGADFTASTKVKGLEERQVLMPTVSADEKTLVFVESKDGTQSGNNLFTASLDNGSVSNIKELKTLSEDNISDSYPFLSADGKRLYFTKQHNANIEFYVADAGANGNFGAPEKLAIEIPKVSNNMSCVLSNDELDIYVLSGDHIYHAQRKAIDKAFSTPVKIASSHTEGYMTGIAMTNDTEELYVFNSVGFRNTQVLKYINTKARNQSGTKVQFVDVE
ncbi:MAG: hypothetical protein WD048_00445 [Chitinophagales bacterium]